MGCDIYMRDSLSSRRSKYDDIILGILRGKTHSRKELLELNKDEKSPLKQIPYPTLDRRLKQLEKFGLIKHMPDKYKIAETVEEADPDEIRQCLEVIRNKNESEEVVQDRVKQLRILSQKKRVASLSAVLSTLEESLENPKIVDNPKTFEELTFALGNMLSFEQTHNLTDSGRYIERMTNNILRKIVEIVDGKTEFPANYAVHFLALSGRKEAVGVLFRKMEKTTLDCRTTTSIVLPLMLRGTSGSELRVVVWLSIVPGQPLTSTAMKLWISMIYSYLLNTGVQMSRSVTLAQRLGVTA